MEGGRDEKRSRMLRERGDSLIFSQCLDSSFKLPPLPPSLPPSLPACWYSRVSGERANESLAEEG